MEDRLEDYPALGDFRPFAGLLALEILAVGNLPAGKFLELVLVLESLEESPLEDLKSLGEVEGPSGSELESASASDGGLSLLAEARSPDSRPHTLTLLR